MEAFVLSSAALAIGGLRVLYSLYKSVVSTRQLCAQASIFNLGSEEGTSERKSSGAQVVVRRGAEIGLLKVVFVRVLSGERFL